VPKDSLPERLQDPDNWKNTDADVWYMRWKIPLKGLFAYGPRSSKKWARWREFPKTLFAIRGKGAFRFESEGWERDSDFAASSDMKTIVNKNLQITRSFLVENYRLYKMDPAYLSAIQYWCKWHFQIQWPVFIAFHYRFNYKYTLYFRIGARRDADKVYWFPSFYIGLTFN